MTLMTFRPISVVASLVLAGTLAAPTASTSFVGLLETPKTKTEALLVSSEPVADLISTGEGDWNAVNQGWAGDTPGGLQHLLGHTCEKLLIAELLRLQNNGTIYAVGRYQFVPSTLRFALEHSEITERHFFSPDVQQKLFVALLEHKRPVVGEYIAGEHDDIELALDRIAREWSSVEYRYGRGFYDHIHGNRAHITREEMRAALIEARTRHTNGVSK